MNIRKPNSKLFLSRARVAVFTVLLAGLASFAGGCEPGGESRVARWPLSVFPGAEKKKAIATLSQGERVSLLAPGDAFSQIRMVDGQEGFVESKHLFLYAAVLSDPEALLYRRPSASSGEAASGKYLAPGVVFFVKERERNDESRWMSVEGGRKGNFFRGWLKEDISHSADVDTVQAGLRLSEAVRKQDLETLEELSARGDAIGPAAAAALVELEGPREGEGDADGSEGSSDSGDANSSENSTSDEKPGPADGEAQNKPAPPAPPSGEVSAPATATSPSEPPPPPPSL